MDKKEMRKMIRTRLRSLTAEEISASSEALFRKVAALPEFVSARTVGLFMSLADEPQTRPFIDSLRGAKRIVIPRVEGDVMTFCEYSAERLTVGAFGIAEPSADAVPCRADEIDLLVVPAVGYTADGRRLGRGKGYYDRYAASEGFRAFTVGVCFACQLVGDMPTERHDMTADTVIWG